MTRRVFLLIFCFLFAGCAVTYVPLNKLDRPDKIRQLSEDQFNYMPNKFAITQQTVPHLETSRYGVFSLAELGKNGRLNSALYFQSRSSKPFKKSLIVILPIYGNTEAIPHFTASHLIGPDTNVIIVNDPGDLWDWEMTRQIHTPKELEKIAGAAATTTSNAVIFVRKLIDWSYAQPDINQTKIGIVGFSTGAMIAAIAMGRDSRIRAGVFAMGGGKIQDVIVHSKATFLRKTRKHLKKVVGISEKELHGILEKYSGELNPSFWAKNINPKNVLVVEADKDDFIPEESRKELWTSLGFPEKITLPYRHKVSFLALSPLWGNYTNWKIRGFFQRKFARDT